MNLKQYLDKLNSMAKGNPALLDLQVITSKDDEGNGYNHVHYDPTIGTYDEEDFSESPFHEANSICVN